MASNDVPPENDQEARLRRFLKHVLPNPGLYAVAIFRRGANAHSATSLAVVATKIVILRHGCARAPTLV